MNHLLRERALTEQAWAEVEAGAASTVAEVLAGRRLLDVVGPLCWEHSAEPTGRTHHVGVAPGVAGPDDD